MASAFLLSVPLVYARPAFFLKLSSMCMLADDHAEDPGCLTFFVAVMVLTDGFVPKFRLYIS